MNINGIHHITMVSSQPELDHHFYSQVLGFDTVKKTVNFDDPFVYHLYYGDARGSPSTLLTFFPYGDVQQATHGNNEIRALGFTIADAEFWSARLASHGVTVTQRSVFDQTILCFTDPNGLEIELCVSDEPIVFQSSKLGSNALGQLYTIALYVPNDTHIVALLKNMNYVKHASQENRTRYKAPNNTSVDVIFSDQPPASPGAGSVHHLAFHTPTDESQIDCREILTSLGYQVTSVVDRQYFHSIYFRTHEGLLFEIATTQPGMFIDEQVLGSSVQIPPQHQKYKDRILSHLPPLK